MILGTQDQHIVCSIKKHPRSKRMRITIRHDRTVVVTVPRWATKRQGEMFLKQHQEWIARNIASLPTRQLSPHARKKDYIAYKEQARRFVIERLEHWNQSYTFLYKKVSIRNQQTRWGSCSKKGNLNFNYKLVLLPQSLADYVIVHELCHLQELNHSRAFWNLVAQTMPDYMARRRELRACGNLLRGGSDQC